MVKPYELFGELGIDYPTLKRSVPAGDRLMGLSANDWDRVLRIAQAAGDRELAAEALRHVNAWNAHNWGSKVYFAALVSWVHGGLRPAGMDRCRPCEPGYRPLEPARPTHWRSEQDPI